MQGLVRLAVTMRFYVLLFEHFKAFDGEPRGFGAFRHLANILLPPSGEVPKAIGACQRYSVLC